MPREAPTPREHEPLLQNGTHYCDVDATEEPRGASNGSDTGRCRDKAITVFGWCFDFVTVAISLVDVVFDILVALQFLRDGHTTWGWLVLGCLINSNVVYSLIIADNFNQENFGRDSLPMAIRRLPAPMVFCIVFPFAQLTPTLNYFYQTFIVHRSSGGEQLDGAQDTVGGNGRGRGVLEDEQRAVRTDVATMGRLHAALKKQFFTHGLLFTETVVESIPQSIIQLLAITFLGEPSTVQVLSMSLSLLSVVSKGYFLSVSCDIRIFFFKFLLVAHDVFSMFYVFCTILSKDGPKEVELFPHTGFEVSWVAYIWFMKVFVLATFLVVASLATMVWASLHEVRRNGLRETFPVIVFAFFFGCLVFVPLLVAAEAAKLTWLLSFWLREEPKHSQLEVAAMSMSFLLSRASRQGCEVWRERQARYAHIHTQAYIELLVEREAYHVIRNSSTCRRVRQSTILNHTARLQMHLERRLLSVLQSDPRTRTQIYDSSAVVEPERPDYMTICRDEQLVIDPVLTPTEIRAVYQATNGMLRTLMCSFTRDELFSLPENREVVRDVRSLEKELDKLCDAGEMTYGERELRMRSRIIELIYDPNRLHRIQRKYYPLIDPIGNVRNDVFIGVVYNLFLLFEGLSAVLSFLFPFVNYGMYFASQNLLQHVCFGLLAASLIFTVPLLPSAVEYSGWVAQWDTISWFIAGGRAPDDKELTKTSLERFQKVIVAYHHPAQETLLRSTVDALLIPPDVSGVVAEFLPDSSGVNMGGLTLEDCARYREF